MGNLRKKINFFKNRLLLNRDYYGGKAYLSAYPSEITVELTNKCNLDCIFCPHGKMKRSQGFMEFPLFKKIIDEVSGFIECIDLDLLGESTLHPEVFDMITYCKKSGLKAVLNSNMAKVDRALAKSLIDSGLDMLVMSIDGVKKQTYENLRRGASFEETKNNIYSLLRLESKGVYRVVQMVYIVNNKNEAGEFIKQWRNKGVDFVRIQPYQNVDRQNIQLNALSMRRNSKRHPCVHPWRKMAICWDGIAVACCNDYDKFQVVGDAKIENVFDIWNGKVMQEVRKGLTEGNFHKTSLCEKCFLFEPGNMVIWGSIFLNPVNIRKLLFIFERLMVFNRLCLFRYF
jgi:wyosine [tRNA(Phe)-imidazoG37] synthetase (radical SAM superfamily)